MIATKFGTLVQESFDLQAPSSRRAAWRLFFVREAQRTWILTSRNVSRVTQALPWSGEIQSRNEVVSADNHFHMNVSIDESLKHSVITEQTALRGALSPWRGNGDLCAPGHALIQHV